MRSDISRSTTGISSAVARDNYEMKKSSHKSKFSKSQKSSSNINRPFNPNISYLLADFLEDMESVSKSITDDIIVPTRSFQPVDEETGSAKRFTVNPNTILFKLQHYFDSKYSDWNICSGRLVRYYGIKRFIGTYGDRLCEERLLLVTQDGEQLEESFLEYLLNAKADPETAEISEQTIDNFLRGKQQKRLQVVKQ